MFCKICNKHTKQKYYSDYRAGSPNAYYQCAECGTCWYRCNAHKGGHFFANRATDAQEKGVCECYNEPKLCPECDSEILPDQTCMMGHWCGESVIPESNESAGNPS